MLRLQCGRCNVLLAGCGLFGRRRPGGHTACAAVIAHAIHRDIVVDHGLVVGVVHDGDVYVGHRTVIDESTAAPIPARITRARVAEAVIDSAIKTDVWSPVPGVPNVDATSPAPVRRAPISRRLLAPAPRKIPSALRREATANEAVMHYAFFVTSRASFEKDKHEWETCRCRAPVHYCKPVA